MSLSWFERIMYHDDTPRPPTPSRSTVTVAAHRLRKGVMVLTQTSQYGYRAERITWIEKPRLGPVVVNLEGTDRQTGEFQQRWHQWRPSEQVTVFVAEVDPYETDGDYSNLLKRYGMAEQQQDKEEVGAWQRVSKLTIPE
jgi:hypothetical protein